MKELSLTATKAESCDATERHWARLESVTSTLERMGRRKENIYNVIKVAHVKEQDYYDLICLSSGEILNKHL